MVRSCDLASIGGLDEECQATARHDARLAAESAFYVVRHAKDDRDIAAMIAGSLRSMGHNASSGTVATLPDVVDILVTYEDRWYWDMATYMLSIEIKFRDPQTEAVLASGKSMRTSLARKSPEYMTNEVLREIFSKVGS